MGIIYTVPQSHCVIIERFGKFARIQREGMHFKLPFMEKVRCVPEWGDQANKRGYQIELTEQRIDTPKRQCHTQDNVMVTANAVVYWRIVDPRKAVYEVDELTKSVSDVALNALRATVGSIELDDVLSRRVDLSEKISALLADTGEKWGIQFTRIEIQELETDSKVARSMQQQMDAERQRRSIIAKAEGSSEAKVKVAEAEKQATIIRAEGHAKALEIVAHAEQQYLMTVGMGVSDTQAAKLLMAQKFIEGFQVISTNPAHKVFLPNNFQALFSFPTDDPDVAMPANNMHHDMDDREEDLDFDDDEDDAILDR